MTIVVMEEEEAETRKKKRHSLGRPGLTTVGDDFLYNNIHGAFFSLSSTIHQLTSC